MRKLLLFFISVFILQYASAQNFPVANNDTFTINKNNQVLLPVLSNDFDIDGDSLTITILIPPVNGTATVSGSQISYLSDFNYWGCDSLTYIICDSTNRCDTAVLVLSISNVNNPPVAANDTFSISRNNTATLPVLSNDYDPDGDPVTVNILVNPLHGSASVSNNQVVYTPNSNYQGVDSVKYIVCDTVGCDTAVLVIFVGNYNNGPVAIDDFYNIPSYVLTDLPVLSNDFEPHGGILTITIVISPANGTANVNGSVIDYTPNPFFIGLDSFTYIICDTANLCDTATVHITITGFNQPPIYEVTVFYFGDTITSATINQSLYDPDGDSIFYSFVINLDLSNSIGSLIIDSNGVMLTFLRNGTACGTNRFQFILCDPFICDTGIITIHVICPDGAFLPEGFSPDGDGINDKLVFKGLESFSPAGLKIYNRYGTMVYGNDDYKNDWNGTYLESGKALPDGTYFYILELTDGRKYNNYLIINR